MKNLIAVIPARKIDQFLPLKNMLQMGSTNLLEHKIKQLKGVEKINEIIVSSDCEEFLNIAISNGVSIDIRPTEHSQIDSNFSEFISYIIKKVDARHVLWAPTITPFIETNDYSNAINQYFRDINLGFDSLISVNKLRRNLLDENGPLNFNFYDKPASKFPNIYEYINGITIAPKEDILKWKYNWGKNPSKYELSALKSINICDISDLAVVEILFNALYE